MSDIQPLLERVRKIDKAIAWYQARREAVLREDADYANYLDRYAAMYQDEPLTIHRYYQFMDMLHDAYANADFDDPLQVRGIVKIEQRLAI